MAGGAPEGSHWRRSAPRLGSSPHSKLAWLLVDICAVRVEYASVWLDWALGGHASRSRRDPLRTIRPSSAAAFCDVPYWQYRRWRGGFASGAGPLSPGPFPSARGERGASGQRSAGGCIGCESTASAPVFFSRRLTWTFPFPSREGDRGSVAAELPGRVQRKSFADGITCSGVTDSGSTRAATTLVVPSRRCSTPLTVITGSSRHSSRKRS